MPLPKGRHRLVDTDFSRYAVEWFSPYLYNFDTYAGEVGCGRTALSLITGINPSLIPARDNYTDRFMTNFLRERGCKVLTVTQCDVTQNADAIVYEIEKDFVVLMSQLMTRKEASWAVTYGGLHYHNFGVHPFSGLELLNKPLLSAYVIYHEKWGLPLGESQLKSESKPANAEGENHDHQS